MLERLPRFRSDWFEFRKSVFLCIWDAFCVKVSVRVTIPRCFDWLVLVRVSKSVSFFFNSVFCFSYLEAIVWERLYHFHFGLFNIRKSVISIFIFFRLKLVWERLFPLLLTDSGSSFEICFLILLLGWCSFDNDYLALVSIRVLKVHISIFHFFQVEVSAGATMSLTFWLIHSGSSFETGF